jgi:hypothetical protein
MIMESVAQTETPRKLPPAYAEALRIEVATLQAKHPVLADMLSRANAVLQTGRLYPGPDNQDALVRSVDSEGQEHIYHTNGTCDCPHGLHHPEEVCKHRYALRLHQLVMGQLAHAEAPPAEKTPVPAHFIEHLQGKPFIKYVGLLQMAHAQGLVSLQAEWTFNDADVSLARAVAVFSDGRRFEEAGDSTPDNAKRVKEHWRRLALTRAKARTLRDGLGIDMAAVEEME